MTHRLRRRSFLLQVVGVAAGAGGALAVVAPASAQIDAYTDRDPTDPPGRGRGTGATDRDPSDAACFGRGRSESGIIDSDGTDARRRGRGRGVSDSDRHDMPCGGRGAPEAANRPRKAPPGDGYGQGAPEPAPARTMEPPRPAPRAPVRDSDAADASGMGRRPAARPPARRVTDNDVGAGADPAGRGRGAADAARSIPSFPWPPPQPSQRLVLPRERLVPRNASVHAVGRRIEQALDRAGYNERSVYSAPNGVAIVSRLERILPDGRPAGGDLRYVPPGREPFSLSAYLSGLFVAPVGYFRMIAFVLTSQAVVPSDEQLSQEEAARLLARGADRLPPYLTKIPFGPAHEVVALIYEFEKVGARQPLAQVNPGRLAARAHLERAGLATLLR